MVATSTAAAVEAAVKGRMPVNNAAATVDVVWR